MLEILHHLPEYIQLWAVAYGRGMYVLIGVVIFAETGLVVTPFLPGDSLLFATGAVLALQFPGLSLAPMAATLIGAAFLGDLTNYHVGKWAAPKLFGQTQMKWLNRRHLERTQEFYARHGGRTLVVARFVPIVRTYAPFVAGVAGMTFTRFVTFSFAATVLWITTFLSLGYFFGNLPGIKSNFHYAIAAIILISVIPIGIEFLREKKKSG